MQLRFGGRPGTRDRFSTMVDVLTFDLSDLERYADVLRSTVAAVADDGMAAAAERLQPISGEVWMGRLKTVRAQGGGAGARSRPRNETLRAQVFIRGRVSVHSVRRASSTAQHPRRGPRLIPRRRAVRPALCTREDPPRILGARPGSGPLLPAQSGRHEHSREPHHPSRGVQYPEGRFSCCRPASRTVDACRRSMGRTHLLLPRPDRCWRRYRPSPLPPGVVAPVQAADGDSSSRRGLSCTVRFGRFGRWLRTDSAEEHFGKRVWDRGRAHDATDRERGGI